MKNHRNWFCRHFSLGFIAAAAWMISSFTFAMAQQGVAPPSSGYGNRAAPATIQQPIGQVNGGNPVGQAYPSQGTGSPVNPTLNPALNQAPLQNQAAGVGDLVVTKDPYADKPLSPQALQQLDQILNYWERSTADIERYSCRFLRWQYNSSDNFVGELAKRLGADVRAIAVTTSSGELKYMSPDKGMFKIDKLLKLSGQLDDANRPEYKEYANQFGEWWLCDGERVYEYDRSGKKCTRYTMPPELKGTGILESPMPFMFGVKAEKIKARYWLRLLAPPNDKQGKPRSDIYVIEAYPKLQADAVNYDHVQIYLDQELFLPIMLIKYNTEHVDETQKPLNDNREVFEFSERVKNATVLQKIGQIFHKSFIPFDIPKDWKVEDKIFAPPGVPDIRAAGNPVGPQLDNAPNLRQR